MFPWIAKSTQRALQQQVLHNRVNFSNCYFPLLLFLITTCGCMFETEGEYAVHRALKKPALFQNDGHQQRQSLQPCISAHPPLLFFSTLWLCAQQQQGKERKSWKRAAALAVVLFSSNKKLRPFLRCVTVPQDSLQSDTIEENLKYL